MNLLPKSASQFTDSEYWQKFYSARGSDAFEWYGEFSQLSSLLSKYVRTSDRILVAGCGNSTLSADMHRLGFRNLESVDISDAVIDCMQKRYAADGVVFKCMDMTFLQYEDASFSCVIDKGTLDAMFISSDEGVVDKVTAMLKEIDRVLKTGGRYVCVSLLQPHISNFLLDWFSRRGWLVRVCRCRAAESTRSNGVRFPIYVVVCTKLCRSHTGPAVEIIEACLNEEARPVRLDSTTTLRQLIADQQRYAFMSHVARGRHCSGDVTFEVCSPANQQTRYTLHVVDRWRKKTNKAYAIFIVPHGRETEWMFSSREGQLRLADSVGFDRLLVVHLHADENYGTMSDVQGELSSLVLDFRPTHLSDGVKVPFLTSEESLGLRHVLYRGSSQLSGQFVVEHVQLDGGALFRRLLFLSSRTVVQSEARCLPVNSSAPTSDIENSIKDRSLWTIDSYYLCCQHHRFMALSAAVIEGATHPRINGAMNARLRMLIIGIGGGSLVGFMCNKFSQWDIDAVDIDGAVIDMARDWFDFDKLINARTTVHVADGLQFIQHSVDSGTEYDLVMFDVDSKDMSQGMSGPPASFVTPQLLKSVKRLLKSRHGILVLNLAARNTELRQTIHTRLAATFPLCCYYQLPEEVNQVVYCHTSESESQQEVSERLREACTLLSNNKAPNGIRSKDRRRRVSTSTKSPVEKFIDTSKFMSMLTFIT